MKRLFLVLVNAFLAYNTCNAQQATLLCGDNQVMLDSSVNADCSFFSDSLIFIYFDKPYAGSRVQVAFFPEDGLPFLAWYKVDEHTRAAYLYPVPFPKERCKKGKLYIMYQVREVNIQNYKVNIGL